MSAEDEPEEGRSRILADSLRRAVVSTLSAVFMTEEGIRNLVGEMRLPKEAMAYVLQQTDKTRREATRIISRELRGIIAKIDWVREVRRILHGTRVQVRAEVQFKPAKRRARASRPVPSPPRAPTDTP